MKKIKHWLGRPPRDAVDVLRLNTRGRWVKDDGKPGRAFSGQAPNGIPCAWGPGCDCSMLDACPHKRAMCKTATRWSCANGRTMLRTDF